MFNKMNSFFVSLVLIPVYFFWPVFTQLPGVDGKDELDIGQSGVLYRAHQLIHDWHFYLELGLMVGTFFFLFDVISDEGKTNYIKLILSILCLGGLIESVLLFPLPY